MDDSELQTFLDSLAHATSVEDILALPSETEAVMISQMDDQKAEALTALPCLRVLLTDGNNRTSDDGVAFLVRISTLCGLDLEWSDVTDLGVRSLAELRGLTWLDLGGCSGVSDAAVDWFRLQLPECVVEYWPIGADTRSN